VEMQKKVFKNLNLTQ